MFPNVLLCLNKLRFAWIFLLLKCWIYKQVSHVTWHWLL